LHGIAWYCMVLHGIAWYCTVLHCRALSCAVLHYLALSCSILHYLALSCTVLHCLALSCTVLHCLALSCTILHIRYTCSQQITLVIAFDIALVALKVKVQCCYIMADMLNLKKVGWWITSRSGWLLELLTELKKIDETTISNSFLKRKISRAELRSEVMPRKGKA